MQQTQQDVGWVGEQQPLLGGITCNRQAGEGTAIGLGAYLG